MPLPKAIRVGRPEKVRSVIEDMTLEALVELEKQSTGTAVHFSKIINPICFFFRNPFAGFCSSFICSCHLGRIAWYWHRSKAELKRFKEQQQPEESKARDMLRFEIQSFSQKALFGKPWLKLRECQMWNSIVETMVVMSNCWKKSIMFWRTLPPAAEHKTTSFVVFGCGWVKRVTVVSPFAASGTGWW